jgi:hypothetical protein
VPGSDDEPGFRCGQRWVSRSFGVVAHSSIAFRPLFTALVTSFPASFRSHPARSYKLGSEPA